MHDMSSVFIVFMMHYILPAAMTSYVQCSKSQQGALLNVTTFRPRDTNNTESVIFKLSWPLAKAGQRNFRLQGGYYFVCLM